MWWPFGGNAFPGTNLQDINLDWIIRRVKELSSGIIAPYINKTNNHWMEYDSSAEQFVDSGVSAAGEGTGPQGEPGKSPVIGDNGNWYVYDIGTAAYVDTGVPARAVGVPAGGAAGQVLTKTGSGDYVTGWQDITGGADDALLAYVVDGDSSDVTIPADRYVIIKNHSTLADGIYRSLQTIPANETITASMVTALTRGGFNDVKPIALGGTGASNISSARANLELSGSRSGTFSLSGNTTGVITLGEAAYAFVLFAVGTGVSRQGIYIGGKPAGATQTPNITTISAASAAQITPGEGIITIANTQSGRLNFIYLAGDLPLLPDIVTQ